MLGSPPPFLAATMMARDSLLHSLPRLASTAPFLCLMVAQWLWPDMTASLPSGAASFYGNREQGEGGSHCSISDPCQVWCSQCVRLLLLPSPPPRGRRAGGLRGIRKNRLLLLSIRLFQLPIFCCGVTICAELLPSAAIPFRHERYTGPSATDARRVRSSARRRSTMLQRKWSHTIRCGLACLACLLASSCGSGGPQLHPVRGQVFFREKPAEDAHIVFHPVGGKDDAIRPSAIVGADGTFNLSSKNPDDGAPAGDYVVAVVWYDKKATIDA